MSALNDGDRKGIATHRKDRFTTASEFYGDESAELADLPQAKTIIWYDQLTPIFACEACVDHVVRLRFAGDGRADDHDERRADALAELWDGRKCDVCTGDLPGALDGDDRNGVAP